MVDALGGVAVDVRGLQAHDHATRGIGRYTLDLAREVERRAPGLVRSYVVDPAFPVHARALELEPTGRLVRADDPSLLRDPPRVLHVTSPFAEPASGDPPVLPQWARHRDLRLLATVYDLIPARFPDVYLRDPVVAARYSTRLSLLRDCDRLLAISQATADDAVALLGVPEQRVRVVRGGTDTRFSPAEGPLEVELEALEQDLAAQPWGVPPVGRGFVLCPTGMEWRKNLDNLLRAWALVDRGARGGRRLVVQCHLDPAARDALVGRAEELGVGDQLVLTGAVGDDTLVRLYRCADLVVFPSRYEGLGLPVLEARRCGAPVVVGDNSSLRELVTDPAARFDADDVEAIADTLERHLSDDTARAALTAAPVPDGFDWPAAADAVVAEYREQLSRRERIRLPRRPRLAFASPVPPQLSGPSKYFAQLVPGLHRSCELTVLVSVDPSSVDLPEGVRVERLADLPAIEAVEGPFDEVLYEIGNSEHHLEELRMLRRRPGAVFLHDARLTLLYTELARRHPDECPGGLHGALHGMYPGRYPDAMGGAGYLPIPEEQAFGLLMTAEVASLASRLFVHSPHAAQLVELDCGRRPEALFPIPCPPLAAGGEVRDGVGVGVGVGDGHPGPLVASFGFVSPTKRSDDLVRAVARLPSVRLALVGHSGPDYLDQLRDLADTLGAGDRVVVTGKVDEDEYLGWMRRADLAVQLRRFSNGESSASVAEALAAGVPTLVSGVGTFADYPPDVVAQVPGEASVDHLADAIASLVGSPDRLAALRDAGRRYAAEHSYDRAAALLAGALAPAGPGDVGSAGTC